MLTADQIEKIQEILPGYNQFGLWKKEVRDGKQTKVPHSAKRLLAGARVNCPDDWGTIDDQVQHLHDFDGLSVLLSEKLCAIDIDHAIKDNGTLAPLAIDVMDLIPSYWERSPSGTGLHGFFYVNDVPDKDVYYLKNSKPYRNPDTGEETIDLEFPNLALEQYHPGVSNRVMTITGNVVRDLPITDQTENYKTFLNKYMRRPSNQCLQMTTEMVPVDIGDAKLIELATTRNSNFAKLWAGDASAYGSRSEADLALLCHLAFWTGRDGPRMERLFYSSGLYRSKWDREDYRRNSIDMAISLCTSSYGDKAKPPLHKPYKPWGSVELSLNSVNPEKPFEAIPNPGSMDTTISGNEAVKANTADCESCIAEAQNVTDDDDLSQENDRSEPIVGMVNFSSCEILSCSDSFATNDHGVYSVSETKAGIVYTPVTYCPITISAVLTDTETGDTRIMVKWRRGPRWLSLICKPAELFDRQKIIQFANRDFPVSSDNAGSLVKFLASVRNLNEDSLDFGESISHLGWLSSGRFFPYCENVLFMDPGGMKHVFEAIANPRGDSESYIRKIGSLRRNLLVRLMIDASLAAPLVKLAGGLSFAVHLWSSKKTLI